MGTITGANAVYTITIPGLFNAPQQLQGFAADDVFTTEPLANAEVLMGVDGIMSSGFVFVPVRQMIALQADSASNNIFDQWWLAMQAARDTLIATGVIILTTIGIKWSMSNGVLTTYPPVPDTKKLLQPRRFGITWGSITNAPTPPTNVGATTILSQGGTF